MKKLFAYSPLIWALLSVSTVHAQMVGDNIFLAGGYVEVGIGPNGCLGTTRGAPSGYYPTAPGFTNYDPALGATATVGANQLLAMMYDQGHDGWTVGTPAHFGDYTLPGTPFEGWSIEIAGTRSNAWYTDYQGGTGFDNYPSATSAGLAGTNTSYTNTGSQLIGLWNGTAGPSGALSITQTTTVDTLGSWVRFNVKLVNTSSSPLTGIYYMRSCDPDNDSYTGGSATTDNSIDYQDDYAHRVQVTAAGTHFTTQTLSLSTKDCRAKCFIGTLWPTFVGTSGTLANYYSGTASGESSTAGTTDVGDYAIGIVYNIGTLAAHDSTYVNYAYVYNGLLGIDSAIADPVLVTLGTPHDSTDTVAPCAYSGDSLQVTIANASTDNWLGSVWTWSPSTFLYSTTGTSNWIIGLSSTTVYTITGVDTTHGECESKTFYLTVLPPGVTPPPTVHDTSFCFGSTSGPITATASGSGLLWYTTATGGSGSATAPTPPTTTIGTLTYWVSETIGGCLSARVPVHVNIVPLPGTITGSSIICVGSSATEADTSVGGHWTSSTAAVATIGSSTGLMSGVSVGTSTISYTVSSGCSATRVVTVTTLPGIISGPLAFCQGTTTTLSDGGGGTWTSLNTPVATVGSATGVVSGLTAGTSTIVYTLGTGCTRSAVVTVNPSPAAITGTLHVCVGFTTPLGDITTGGVWSSSIPGIGAISGTGVVTGMFPGTTLISYSLGGCSATTTFTVNGIPSGIIGPAAICAGTSITLIDITGGGHWSSSVPSVATIGSTTGLVNGVASGSTTITYTLATGCYTTFPMVINTAPGPITGSLLLCVGYADTLHDTSTGGYWTAATPVVTIDPATGIASGIVADTVTVSYTIGLCSVNAVLTVNASPGSITGSGGPLCVGATMDLTGPGGGTWSSDSTTVATVDPTGLVSGVSVGTATISYTLPSTGCSSSYPVTVNVSPLPIGGPSAVCVGLTIPETESTPGGTWSASGHATITGGGIVTGSSAGLATITYTGAGGCIATKTITVNNSPLAITATPSFHICPGTTTTLADLTGGGTWTIVPTATGTISTGGVVMGIAPGVATVTYSLGAGCQTTTTVTVNPLPGLIGGTTHTCVGSCTTLTDGGGGTWSTAGAIATVTPTSGSVCGVSAGIASITFTLTGTSCYRTTPVTVNAAPTAFTVTGGGGYCAGGTGVPVGLSGSSIGISYQLYLGASVSGAAVPGTGTPISFGLKTTAGTYTVIATNTTTGCTANMTGSVTITINPLPPLCTVTGGGPYCAGGTGLHIELTCSSTGISYQLLNGGVGVVSLAGTGSALDFGLQTAAGTYTVVATNTTTGCTNTMSGSATITVNPLPGPIIGPRALCPGSTITLSDPGSLGGTWTNTPTTTATVAPTTGIVTGIITGTTTVTYTLPTTCAISEIVTVSPVPGPIIGPAIVCVGLPTTFTDIAPGGLWSTTSSTITIGTSTGTVIGVSTGPATITYSLGGTSCTVTKALTVNAGPAAIGGGGNVCVGDSISLTETTPGGTWTSSATGTATVSATGTVTGVASGTVSISYAVSGGCPAIHTVTVNPLPALIGGPIAVCKGQQITETDGSPTGTWSTTSATITIGATTGTVTGVNPGPGIVTYTLPTGCITNRTITVNPLPAVITGTEHVCMGLTTTLSDPTGGGAWSSGGAAIATVSGTGTVTGIDTGTAPISYTLIGTGCWITAEVTVNAVPGTIGGIDNICVGVTTPLSDAVSGGTWTSMNTAIATIDPTTGMVTGRSAGRDTIEYTVGGCSITTTITVVAAPGSITGAHNVCVGSTTTESDASLGGTWTSGDAAIATVGAGTGIVTGMSSGTVIISYGLGTGCAAIIPVIVNPVSPIEGTAIVCAGQTTDLADTTLGGTWTTAAPAIATVASDGEVSGIAPGTARITYTLPTGCSTGITITVDAVPGAIIGAGTVCQGSQITLTDTTIGGTWSSGSTDTATIDPTGMVTGITAGTATISYTAGAGCSAMRTVTVLPVPAAIAGPTTICVGGTMTLSDATRGGTWGSSATAIAPVGSSTGIVSGIASGSAVISYALPTGCNAQTTVTVTPALGALTGSSQVCVGSSTTLTPPTTGGTWSSSSATAAVDVTGTVTGESAGIATITYSIGSGCTSTMTMTVNNVPATIAGTTVLCQGQNSTFTDITTGGVWSSSDSTTITITPTGTATGIGAGGATISYTLGTGCAATLPVIVNPAPAAIDGILSVCVGQTTTLTDATSPGSWTSAATGVATIDPASGLVTGISTGTATISYSAGGFGCAATAVVTVNNTPSLIAGSSTLCQGYTATYTNMVSGGTWSTTDPTIAIAAIPTTGNITGIGAGTTTITYTVGAGCLATKDITVNPSPSAVSGPDVVCATQTITLTDATTGGTWTSGATPTATVAAGTGVVTGVAAGAATISYSNALGCAAIYNITVNAMPGAIRGNPDVCMGGTSALSDVLGGGVWTITPLSTATISVTGVVTGGALGSAMVLYTMPVSGCQVSEVVNVLPLPTAYTVTGGGNYCAGGAGVHIGLSNSAVGVNYLLYDGVTATGTFAGTGIALDFGLQTVAGIYTVEAISVATGCSINMTGTATIRITPDVIPAVSLHNTPGDTVCAGTAVTFTPTAVNGGSGPVYSWSVNGVSVATSNTYGFIPANGDIVSVTLTSDTTCASPRTATTTETVHVNAYSGGSVSITATPGTTVCQGVAVALSAVPTDGGPSPLYNWIKNGIPAATGGVFTYVPNNGDVVYAIMNSDYPCLTGAGVDTSTAVSLTVDTAVLPIVNISASPGTLIETGQSVTLTATVVGGGTTPSYQWVVNGIPVTGATNSVFVVDSFSTPANEDITCQVVGSSNCPVSAFGSIYLQVANVGVKQLSGAETQLSVQPNPNKGVFSITGTVGSNDQQVMLEVTDLLGQVVYHGSSTAKNGKLNATVSLGDNIANGMYLLNVQTDGGVAVYHVAVEQ